MFVSLACFVCKDLFIRSVNNSCKTVAFPKIKVDNSPSTVPYLQIKTKKCAKFGKFFLLTKICMFQVCTDVNILSMSYMYLCYSEEN